MLVLIQSFMIDCVRRSIIRCRIFDIGPIRGKKITDYARICARKSLVERSTREISHFA